jgi:hypothetical protein
MSTNFPKSEPFQVFSVGLIEGQDSSEQSAHNPGTENCCLVRNLMHFCSSSDQVSLKFHCSFVHS